MAEHSSIQTGQVRDFSTVDIVVFTILIVANAGIGLFYAVRGCRRKNDNVAEYLLGGRSMNVVPVSLSLTVTFLSANTLLGTPVDVYKFHIMFIYLGLGILLATTTAGLVFIPFFYRLGITSTFQYLEMRFSYPVRLLGSFLLVIQTLLYMAFVLYAPSLALSAVADLNFDWTVIGVGIVVTFYTTLGGMKAVVWTDTFQSVVIIAGILAVFIQGCIEAGGFPAAWRKADSRSRVVLDDFDPATRHSFWSVVVGGGFFWMSLYGVNQAQVQRCLSTQSVSKARLAIAISTPPLILLGILSCLIGIVMFSYYADCDPVKFQVIEKADQMLPLFVMDILGHLKGIPGMFVASIFSGSLSTISSGLNAISAIVYKDFLQTCCCKNSSDFTMTILSKLLAAVFGAIMIGLVFLVAELGTLQQTSMTVYGILNGPIFGLFVLGMFIPWANAWGALVGCLSSVAFMAWIGIGAYVHEVRTAKPGNTTTVGCNFAATMSNVTTMATTTMTMDATTVANTTSSSGGDGYEGVYRIYTLSYLYYTVTGMLFSVVVGLIISFLTGYTRPTSLESRLICLPNIVKSRFGFQDSEVMQMVILLLSPISSGLNIGLRDLAKALWLARMGGTLSFGNLLKAVELQAKNDDLAGPDDGLYDYGVYKKKPVDDDPSSFSSSKKGHYNMAYAK